MKIEITDSQRKDLQGLWFIYGNGGQKSNFAQHKFIQWILEQGEYLPKKLKGPRARKMAKICAPNCNFDNYNLSDACLNAVKLVLGL